MRVTIETCKTGQAACSSTIPGEAPPPPPFLLSPPHLCSPLHEAAPLCPAGTLRPSPVLPTA